MLETLWVFETCREIATLPLANVTGTIFFFVQGREEKYFVSTLLWSNNMARKKTPKQSSEQSIYMTGRLTRVGLCTCPQHGGRSRDWIDLSQANIADG